MREVALKAIQAGDVAELNRLRDGRTLVHAAVQHEDVGLMRDLMRAGADGMCRMPMGGARFTLPL